MERRQTNDIFLMRLIAVKKFQGLVLVLLGFRIAFLPSTAIADPDFDHHRNVLPGSRAAGLGGAYTALSDDPSGSYYNPAGLVHTRDLDVSVSVNSFQVATLKYKNIAALNDQDFEEDSQTIFPSFVGSNYRFGWLHLAWSYVTLDTKNIDQTTRFSDLSSDTNSLDSYNRTHQEVNTHFLAGLSAGISLGDNFSLGLSSYYYRRSIIASNHQLVRVTTGSFLTSDQKYTTLNEGLLPVFGAMLKFSNFAFGLSVRQGMRLTDNTTLLTDSVSYSTSSTDPVPQISSTSIAIKTNDEANPLLAQVGAAWLPSKYFLLSCDIEYADGKSDNPHYKGANELQPTFNYAVGTELTGKFAFVRLGYFTNNSQFKNPRGDAVNQPTKIDYIGKSVSLGIIRSEFSGDLTLIDQLGTGRAQKLSDDTDIQKVEGHLRTIQIGTRYGF
jgi:long-chain fatty acid transport protein